MAQRLSLDRPNALCGMPVRWKFIKINIMKTLKFVASFLLLSAASMVPADAEIKMLELDGYEKIFDISKRQNSLLKMYFVKGKFHKQRLC